MTGASGADDGARVDVEAAWAQIVLHWDDERAADGATDRPDAGTGVPVLPAADDAPHVNPPLPAADAELARPPAPEPPLPPRAAGPGPALAADPPVAPARSGSTVWRGPTHPPGATDEDPHEAEGYVPDEPPPLPRGDLVSWLSWGGVLGAPLFLLLAALFWPSAPSLLVAAAVTAFVVGFGTLVVRLPDRREDDGDDGAVV